MNDESTQMRPIWYFVGWVLIIIGVIVVAAGVYYLFEPVNFNIELSSMHISIWWGLVLIFGGTLLVLFNRKG